MLKGVIIVAALLSTMATVSWADDPVGCRKPEIELVTKTKAATAKLVRDIVIPQIVIAINDYGFGKKEMREKDPDGTLRRVMGETYFQQYTKNLNVQVETYLIDRARSAMGGDANDPCYLKITISGIRDVSDASGELLFSMLTYKESQPAAIQKITAIALSFGEKVSVSVSKNYAKIVSGE